MMGHMLMREQDERGEWTKEPQPVFHPGVSRSRRWILPALTVTLVLGLIIMLGASTFKTTNHLWSVEKKVSHLSNAIESLNASLSVMDSLSRSITSIEDSLRHFIDNSAVLGGCCPQDWKSSGLSCYWFSSSKLSWNESRVWCEEHDSHLVMLSSDRVWEFVTRRTINAQFWVGLSDWRTGSWEWVDHTPYTIDPSRWRPGQPDNWGGHNLGPENEDCAHLYINGLLNDFHCSSPMRFVCQRPSSQS